MPSIPIPPLPLPFSFRNVPVPEHNHRFEFENQEYDPGCSLCVVRREPALASGEIRWNNMDRKPDIEQCEWCSRHASISQVPTHHVSVKVRPGIPFIPADQEELVQYQLLNGQKFWLCGQCVEFGASRNFWNQRGERHAGHASVPMDGDVPAIQVPRIKSSWDMILDDDFDERCEAYVPPPRLYLTMKCSKCGADCEVKLGTAAVLCGRCMEVGESIIVSVPVNVPSRASMLRGFPEPDRVPGYYAETLTGAPQVISSSSAAAASVDVTAAVPAAGFDWDSRLLVQPEPQYLAASRLQDALRALRAQCPEHKGGPCDCYASPPGGP